MKKYSFILKNRTITIVLLCVFLGYMFLSPISLLRIPNASAGWWNDSWNEMRMITLDDAFIDADLNNFPVLVVIPDSVGDLCDGGNSIRFVAGSHSGGTENVTTYNYEIEKWVDNEDRLVWVNVTTIYNTGDTIFNMYYGNSGASDGQNVHGTWDGSYKAVYHMTCTGTTTIVDSTGNHRNGTKMATGQPANYTSGKIGIGQDFDGANDYISYTTLYANQLAGTLSGWVNKDSLEINDNILLDQGAGYIGIVTSNTINNKWLCGAYGTDSNLATDPNTFSTGSWYYLTGTYAENTLVYLFKNGVSVASSPSTLEAGGLGNVGTSLKTGIGSPSDYSDGKFDELRVSSIVRSNAYIKADYHTQNRTTGFFTLSNPISTPPDPAIPQAVSPNPTNGSTDVEKSLANYYSHFNITVSDIDDATQDMNITWWTNDSGSYKVIGTNLSVDNGTYFCYNVSWIDTLHHTYYWGVNVSDGTNSSNNTYYFTTENIPPYLTNEYPSNESINSIIQPTLSIDINSSDNDLIDVNWYYKSSGAEFLTGYNKSGNNPLKQLDGSNNQEQGWIAGCYNSYDGRVYLYIQDLETTGVSNTLECYSFPLADANNPGAWTNHGDIYTTSHTWDAGHIEPHGLIFETQAMAEARSNYATYPYRCWRLYICAGGNPYSASGSSLGFLLLQKNSSTTMTTPIYYDRVMNYTTGIGYGDTKAVIYNNKVYMMVVQYDGTNPLETWFRYSDNGINGWTDLPQTNWTDRNAIGTISILGDGILLQGDSGAYGDYYHGNWTNNLDTNIEYASNPILQTGSTYDKDFLWNTLIVDRNGSGNLCGAGTYYMYYIGRNTTPEPDVFNICLATTSNITHQDIGTTDWIWFGSNASIDVSGGTITLQQNGTVFNEYNTTYYWKVTADDGVDNISEIYHFTTLVTSHIPEAISPNPINGSTDVAFSLTNKGNHFSITVQDLDDATQDMNITWKTNESGTWEVIGTNLSVNNGTYYCTNVSWVDTYNQKYYWMVNVSDGENGSVQYIYHFTTINGGWGFTNEYPANGSTDVELTPYMNITLTSNDTDPTDVFWYYWGYAPSYITVWERPIGIPLLDLTDGGQGWMCGLYNDYDERIYLYIQDTNLYSSTVECWSFTIENATESANWTNHGVVYTGTDLWNNKHLEPQSAIFETQAMADARHASKPLSPSARCWRIYYCCIGGGEGTVSSDDGFLYMLNSSMTTPTNYGAVINNTGEWGYGSCKAIVFNDKVYMLVCQYDSLGNKLARFHISDNGINNWTQLSPLQWTDRNCIGTLSNLADGIFLLGDSGSFVGNEYHGNWTVDGETNYEYEGNPIFQSNLSSWDRMLMYNCIIVDKDSNPINQSGHWYLFYSAQTSMGGDLKLGLATSETVVEQVNGSDWVLFGTNLSVNPYGGIQLHQTGSFASTYYTTYFWKVSANDTHENISEIYYFETEQNIDNYTPQPTVWVDDDQEAGWYDGNHVHTIYEGIWNVSDNGTVYVWDGTYYGENISIDKSINLIGNGTDSTYLVFYDFYGDVRPILQLQADNINISGIYFSGNNAYQQIATNIDHNTPIQNIHIFDCVFIDSERGFSNTIDGDSNINISNCEFYDMSYEAIGFGGSNSTVSNNLIYNCDGGIYLYSFPLSNTVNCIIKNNDIYNTNSSAGITLNGVSHTVVSDNTIINGNYSGICMYEGWWSSNNNTIRNNTITYQIDKYGWNGAGISIFDSNTIDNLIYNNIIYNCTSDVYDESDGNIWNTTKTFGTNIIGGDYLGGNYWSDYNGTDINSDGLGDTDLPYHGTTSIFHGGDYLPLTGNWTFGLVNFTVYNNPINLTQILVWDAYIGINTVIRHSLTGFPLTPTSDDAVYNGTGVYTYYSTPTPAQLQYYRAWYYFGGGLYSNYTNALKLTPPFAPTDINVTIINSSTVNVSWTPGVGSNRTIILQNLTYYSNYPSDGTILYNGTGTYYHLNIISSPQYITAWGWANWTYNSTITLSEFSYNGTPVTFKGLGINCYNESNPAQEIPYNYMVRNANGTDVYQSFANLGYQMVNLTGFTTDTNVYIRVWTDGYHARERFLPIFINQFYNLSFYLPRKNIGTGEDPEGGGNTENCELRGYIDSLSVSGNTSDATINLSNYLDTIISVEKYDTANNWTNVPTNKYSYNTTTVIINKTGLESTTTQVRVSYYYYFCSGDTNVAVYYCRVVETTETEYSTYDTPVEGAVVTFKRYMNTTKGFEVVSDCFTDANGYITIYLIPNVQYLVHIEKTGYDPTNSSYVPVPANTYGLTVEKIFRLVKSTSVPPSYNYTYMMKNIFWSFEPKGIIFRTGFTAYFNITSTDNQLEWYSMAVYSYNYTTHVWTNLSYQKGTNAGGGSLHYTVANITGRYKFDLLLKRIGYPAFELSQTGSFEKIIESFSQWMLDIPDYAYYVILLIIMIIVSGFAFMYLGAGMLAGYVGLGVMAMGLLIKPVSIPIGNDIMISGWLIFMITFIFYTIAVFLWSKI